jgi:predicted TIM-barrel fold metal-dependent hydrolase
MSATSTLTRRPTGAGVTQTNAGWTDCDLDPAIFDRHDASALTALGIRRAVVGHLTRRTATLSPAQHPEPGLAATRFVIDAPPDPDAATLRDLHGQGVRGVRFVLSDDAARAGAQLAHMLDYAERIAVFVWHLERALGAELARLADHEWTLTRMPVALCLCGVAQAAAQRPLDDPDLDFALALLQMGRTWLKLSPTAAADDAAAREQLDAFVSEALTLRRDRVIWGSGPRPAQHADALGHVADALALLGQWLGSADDRETVLTVNPARLYGFPLRQF